MLFNSYVFLLGFLPVTYIVFWLLPRASARYVWLAITGYVFYGYWNPWFCLLMAFSTLVSYTAGRGFLVFTTPSARRLCLIVPIAIDLLLLGFFKYANFGLQSAQWLLDLGGTGWRLPAQVALTPGWTLRFADMVVPVGISFYTFHTISYIVDAYRGAIVPTRNFFEFAAYVSLFSQLVAGPIVRFRQIEEDLENLGHASRTRWLSIGVSFFVAGLLEKVWIADTIAAFINPAFDGWRHLSTGGAWLAVLGYTCQLYFDFSGYSSMAIGLGYLFGLRIPINFDSPYKATDPSDFWKRWHISLSTCLRDYLYIPLGGNRRGHVATYRNLVLTMLIGGLWHGANWNFILWGGYHGMLLCIYRAVAPAWDRLPAAVRRLGMFTLVTIGWVFFRTGSLPAAESLPAAWRLLQVMVVPTAGAGALKPEVLATILALALGWAMAGPSVVELHRDFRWRVRHALVYAAVFGGALAIMAGGRNSPFLYFQF